MRADTDASIAAAKTDAENLLCTANAEGEVAAEEVYWWTRSETEARIEQLQQDARCDANMAAEKGRKNIPVADEAIVRFVTME